MLKEIFENVQKKNPLIHNITNHVTSNDCANIQLACGASPIMAEALEEVEEVTAISDGLTLNLGTLHKDKATAVLLAGKKANELGKPVIFDPVGAGVSAFRTETAQRLLEQIRFDVIRGNASEIKSLAFGCKNEGGIDVSEKDVENGLQENIALAKKIAKETGAVIVISGKEDIVADDTIVYCVKNGNPMMSKVTGFGCQLTCLIGAFAAANPKEPLQAALAAAAAMGICGEKAFSGLKEEEGSGTYRMYFMDAVSLLTGEELEKKARYERME